MNRCPVCLYPGMPYPAADYNICPCCGTEFGNDDALHSHAELRQIWIERGYPWFFGNQPENWNPIHQLFAAGLSYSIAPASETTWIAVKADVIGDFKLNPTDDTADVTSEMVAA